MFETIYLGHDNTMDLLLTSEGEPADITNTTVATVEFGSTAISSATSPSAFDWSVGDGVIHLAMGEETIPVGSYNVILTLYDTVNTDGIVWGTFRCRVVAD